MLGHLFSSKSESKPVTDQLGPVPSAVLTRWLRQGIEMGICPLCRVAHKVDREYVWHFSEEGCADADAMAALARARGFCAEHAGMLQRIDTELKSMLGVATIYVELFADLNLELERLDPAAALAEASCPACANRVQVVERNAHYLLACVAAPAGTIAERFPGSPGLCFPHFWLVWSLGGPLRVRQALLDVQRRAVRDTIRDLNEFIRKEGNEAKLEPKGAEQDAWQRAIHLTAGWPAPVQSAGTPEASYFHGPADGHREHQ